MVNRAGEPSTTGTPNEFADMMNVTAPAATSAGRSRGNVTVRKASPAEAPDTRAARTRSRS